MDAEAVARRHKKAGDEALKRDSAYFRNNLHRLHRVRPSLPFEHQGWCEGDHKREPYMIVRRSQDWSEWNRHPVALQSRKGLPNDERFLSLLWRELDERKKEGGMIQFSGERIFELLKEAGLAEEETIAGKIQFKKRACAA
ncbi:hypothetical protein [Hyphomicrobium sp.]|uniref:hypothetical protein n=1 Tax=Hyphomicrobium sp. TaxID=82 RepID=UPI002C18A03A|nr:hypothetical protein [Hyphomicrobium sp.]HRQ25801.1 hypothetical protein [Hyphomicrobium sp.]